MDRVYFQNLLRESLEDAKLANAERRDLDAALRDQAANDDDLAYLRSVAFDLAESHADAAQAIVWLEAVIKRLIPSTARSPMEDVAEAYFSSQHDCSAKIASLISQTTQAIDVCVFTITDDRISIAILDAHRRGLKLRILTDNEKSHDAGSDIRRFERAGIDVRMDRSRKHMHHKFAIFDYQLLLSGSYNWTRGAADHNVENFLVTGQEKLLRSYKREFDRLWKEFG